MKSQLVTYHDPGFDLQIPYDVAVVIPTILRPSLEVSLRSLFSQDLKGRIQILVGIDETSDFHLENILKERPENVSVTVFYPGYSTKRQKGGQFHAHAGGSLRSALSFLANSRYVTYLDDDNWVTPNHLSSLLQAIKGKAWAFCERNLISNNLASPSL